MSKKIDWTRYMSIGFILITILPAIFITRYAGEVGFYIGTALYSLIAMFSLFEILTSFGFNKYLSAFVSLSLIAFMLVDFNLYKMFGETKDIITENDQYGTFVDTLLSWKSYLIVIFVSFIPMLAEHKSFKGKLHPALKQLIVTFVFLIAATFYKAMLVMNAISLEPVFFFILIAVFADSFGYFGGKYLGSKLFNGAKLAPKLSPKKTWAGAVIGFIFSFAFALLFGYYMHIWSEININEWAMSAIMAIVLSVISPIGDLAFSAIKRKVGIKDFSNLLPGHGGIFDRVDAVSVVTTVGALVYIIFI